MMKALLDVVRWAAAASLLAGASLISAVSVDRRQNIARPDGQQASVNTTGSGRLVFAHFMMGITSVRTGAHDYDDDMQRAKEAGIDAFALNIGNPDKDRFTDEQLGYAYESAARNGMKVFISFDFNWFSARSDAARVGQMIAKYGVKNGQLKRDGKVFASSFAGDGLDVAAMRAAAKGMDVFFAPNFSPDKTRSAAQIDGALNWIGWPTNGHNKAGEIPVSDGDKAYKKWLNGKPYIAPVSPWFFTHFANKDYPKNWVFPSDLLWLNRWTEVLESQPDMIEIVTWNDYGESHYVGPLSSPHTDDGSSQWVNDMAHDPWLDMAKPFIAAYKAGATSVDDFIKEDQVFMWHRPTLAAAECDDTDTTFNAQGIVDNTGNFFRGKPDGLRYLKDEVFVVSLLKQDSTLEVQSGQNKPVTYKARAGAYGRGVPMAAGKQSFRMMQADQGLQKRDGLSGESLLEVIEGCWCGSYNMNPRVQSFSNTQRPSAFLKGKAAFARFDDDKVIKVCLPQPTLTAGVGGVGGARPTATAPAQTGASARLTASASASASASATNVHAPSCAPSSAKNATNPTATPASPTTLIASSRPTVSPPVSSALPTNGYQDTCIAGTGRNNYSGLCSYACALGYCPQGPCTCISRGILSDSQAKKLAAPISPGAVKGCPAPGLDDSYKGLCAFTCAKGYCPETACRVCS